MVLICASKFTIVDLFILEFSCIFCEPLEDKLVLKEGCVMSPGSGLLLIKFFLVYLPLINQSALVLELREKCHGYSV